MSKFQKKTVLIIFSYALSLLAISFIRDNALQPDLWIRVSDFLHFPITADPRTFAGAGLEVSENGWLGQDSAWILRLWPPGFVLLLAGIFQFFGADAPFLLVLLVSSISMGVVMLMVVRRFLGLFLSAPWAFALPLVPFAFPVTRFFLLQPIGLAFGEGFSVMFFVTACFLILLAVESFSAKMACVSGLFFALAAYFRSQYELLVVFLFFGGVLIAAWTAFRGGRDYAKNFRSKWSVVGLIFSCVAVAQLFMLPWRIHNYVDSKSLSWVHTSDLVARNGLASDQKLMELGGEFVIMGGGNLACKFEPTYCDQGDRSLFYKAFLQNPMSWLSYKASLAGRFWFPSVTVFPRTVGVQAKADYLGNGAVLCVVPVLLFFLYLVRRLKSSLVYSWLLISFSSCFFAIFALVQFEVRYFYLVKIFVLFVFISLAAMAWSLRFGRVANGIGRIE